MTDNMTCEGMSATEESSEEPGLHNLVAKAVSSKFHSGFLPINLDTYFLNLQLVNHSGKSLKLLF